jgi:ATP-dependent helicase/nuclease subunit A
VLTTSQQQAVAARGNVLVLAGAGTGKTRTLVERCLSCLLDERSPASLDEILMVTFTEAAAAEMRQRIRLRLEEERRQHRNDSRWDEQLALFETAHIGTLHSFCFRLVRQHFYELQLDPQLIIMAEEDSHLLAEETLDRILQEHYAGQTAEATAVQQLIQAQGRGGEKPVRHLVLRLHHYTQTRPDPEGWFAEQLSMFAAREPGVWTGWLSKAVLDWRAFWLPLLEDHAAAGNELAARCAAALKTLSKPELAGDSLESILAVLEQCPYGKKTEWVNPLKEFNSDAEFLLSLFASSLEPESSSMQTDQGRGSVRTPFLAPLAQDWAWVREQMLTLLKLAQKFTDTFTHTKREQGALDFHDLEQYALKLLWDPQARQPTAIARQWRQKLRFVFVDEYQDINAAQDKIIESLSGEGSQANRFLVGDVKQSIYRFRLADPHIFQAYSESWRHGNGTAISLTDNFRSREGILGLINSVFATVMRWEVGGIDYDESSKLRFGAPAARGHLAAPAEHGRLGASAEPASAAQGHPAASAEPASAAQGHPAASADHGHPGASAGRGHLGAGALPEGAGASPGLAGSSEPCVEVHLRTKGSRKVAEAAEPDSEVAPSHSAGLAPTALAQVLELAESDKEARLIALRLCELKAKQFPVWDEELGAFRPVEWKDIAVLLRSPSNKSESYAKEFSRLNVPLLVERSGFYENVEVTDLLSLLQILDNPLQDLPLLAVLRSPLVGLSVDELAVIRLAALKTRFWTALAGWTELQDRSNAQSGAFGKVSAFLERFSKWRRLARQISLSRCLEAVLAETHYAEWLLTQPRGEQRHANVERLLGLAQQFDRFQRQGLFRFIRFIEAQQNAEAEPEVAAVSEENSVRLMSIHQSKGLEFPVVVVADLGKAFNLSDLRADLIMDENYGLCPQIKPPHTGQSYPSLPHWLARQRQKRELLGEELRLLYVAMTRARDRLILTGSIAESKMKQFRTGTSSPTGERLTSSPATAQAAAGAAVQVAGVKTSALLSAQSYSDWLGYWFSRERLARQEEIPGLALHIHEDSELDLSNLAPGAQPQTADSVLSATSAEWQALQQKLAWQYPFTDATRQPAKTSVSAIRRAANDEEWSVEGGMLSAESRAWSVGRGAGKVERGGDIGTAHHTFLQHVSLEQTGTVADLKKEARRLQSRKALKREEAALLDFDSLAAFWSSDLGRSIRARSRYVERELPFTMRLSAQEMLALTGEAAVKNLEDEFVVVQGVADLVVLMPQELWLLDFKTDRLQPEEISERTKLYEPQIKLYAAALSRIYGRPVTGAWLYFLSCREAVRLNHG